MTQEATPGSVAAALAAASEFPDVHQYDPQMMALLPTYPTRSDSEIAQLIQSLRDRASQLSLSEAALHALNVVAADIGKSSNILGNLRADAMLAEIATLPGAEFAEVLRLQLEDMNSGFCPSGRVTRVYQVYKSYIEDVRANTAAEDEVTCRVDALSLT